MSQADILKVLSKRKDGDWVTTNELIKITGLERSSVLSNVRCLRNSGEVISRWTNDSYIGSGRQYEHCLTIKGRGK